jgi:3-oxoacyl-[acyl-carrier protein] reductase
VEIAGKVALVTGAASGIGRATALALAREGASVAIADVDAAGGEETVRQIEAGGGRARFVEADVSTPDGVRAMFQAVESAFGGVDIVHNNAGIMTMDVPGWPDAPLERIQRVANVNVSGVLMGTRAAIDALRKRGGGVVVNTASIAALAPLPNDPIYAASKAAVVHFTRSCADLEKSEGIRVTAVLPGMVDTPIIQKTGDGTEPAAWLRPFLDAVPLIAPEAVAGAVLDLIRDGAPGETRVVDRGGARGA